MFADLMKIRSQLDTNVPKALDLYLAGLRLAGSSDAAVWIKLDVNSPIVWTTVRGFGPLTRLYEQRASSELTKQASFVGNMVRRQILPSYYLAEKQPGFVKNNQARLQWQKDAAATQVVADLAKAIAAKRLSIDETVVVPNPLSWCFSGESPTLKIAFITQLQIQAQVYTAKLK